MCSGILENVYFRAEELHMDLCLGGTSDNCVLGGFRGPVCVGIQCVHLGGMLVAYVFIQTHVVCEYIVVGVTCQYAG